MLLFQVLSLTTLRKIAAIPHEAAMSGWRQFTHFLIHCLPRPKHSALIQRILAMPNKRYNRTQIEVLTRPETEALLAAPNKDTWAGRRDKTLILLTVQTGLRVSELTALRCEDIVLGSGAHVQLSERK